MTNAIPSIGQLSDHDLLTHVQRAAERERDATVELIALLMELDARRLYLAQGCASLFTYCTQILHLSEHAAYGRIAAARAARRFPVILERLTHGAMTLTAIGMLAPHLTPANHLEVLDAARHRSTRDIEHLVARLTPKPDVPTRVRKLPEPKSAPPVVRRPVIPDSSPNEASPSSAASIQVAPARVAEVKPLAPERYKVQFTVSRETYEKLRHAQDLLRHSIPNGDPAAIFDKALTLLIAEVERTKLAAAARPRPTRAARGRHIPATVKRAVWQRDGGRCAFVGTHGRCTETGFLEFHHVVPFAAGGETTIANLALRCRAHNSYEAERYFGLRPPPLVREARDRYGLECQLGPDRGAEKKSQTVRGARRVDGLASNEVAPRSSPSVASSAGTRPARVQGGMRPPPPSASILAGNSLPPQRANYARRGPRGSARRKSAPSA